MISVDNSETSSQSHETDNSRRKPGTVYDPVGCRMPICETDDSSQNHQAGLVVWFTGLCASGKSTLAKELRRRLIQTGHQVVLLDGDEIRQGLSSDLGFSADDRHENIRRSSEVAKLLAGNGVVCIAAFVTPYESDRDYIRTLLRCRNYVEVYVECSLSECERRDPKGLYRKAHVGELSDLSGIGSLFETPE